MVITKGRGGFTLVETMIVVAILGIVVMIAGDLLKHTVRFFVLSQTRVELQREARAAITLITKNIRQAQSSTMRIDQVNGQPYYSRISFNKVQGTAISYYQSGRNLVQLSGTSTTVLSPNLRYLAFTFPRSDDLTIVSVSITLEKSTYQGFVKALHVASEKVQVMN